MTGNGNKPMIPVLTTQQLRQPGDYEESGVLMCGRCHKPKQVRSKIDLWGTGEQEELLPIDCDCRRQEQDEQVRREKIRRDREKVQRMWEDDGITEKRQLQGSFAEDDSADPAKSRLCRRYVEKWEQMRGENIGLLLYGPTGTGKSFFASAIGNALLARGVSVAATSMPRLLNLLQSAADRQRLLDRLGKYDLLILDDLGVERDSSYAAEQVFHVVDSRSRAGRPLIVTTNLSMDELEQPASMQYARIYDRVLELCPVRLRLVGESRRKGNAQARKEIARALLLDSALPGQEGGTGAIAGEST